MPTARTNLAAATVGGSIYAIGGSGNRGGVLNTLETYDTSTGAWTTAASMPTPRSDLAAAVVNGIVYAIGGQTVNGVTGVALNTVEAYNPASNSWSTAASMPTPRWDLAVVAVNGKIYAIGGGGNNSNNYNGLVNTVEVYDPSTNAWSTAAPISLPTYYLAAAQVNGLIYAIGGLSLGAGPGELNVVEQSSPPVTLYTFVKN
jgi:N-acetylneuraminic acid mutarotase